MYIDPSNNRAVVDLKNLKRTATNPRWTPALVVV